MNPHHPDPGGPAPDAFGTDAGAYLLGALGPDERRAFEAHAAGCPACTAELDLLRPVVGLLAGATEADLPEADLGGDAVAQPLPSVLPALLARVATQRRRRRRAVVALGSVAAAAAAALVVTLTVDHGTHQPAGRAMVPVAAGVPLRATVTLTGTHWGTRIELDCTYPSAAGYAPTPATYELEVTDARGARQLLGSWTVDAGGHTRFSSGTALPPGQIRGVRIDLPDGTPVLQLPG